MYKLIIAISLITCFSCNSKKQTAEKNIVNTTNPPLFAMHTNSFISHNSKSPYDIFIDIKKVGKDVYNLVIKMELQDGSFYVSPNSVRDFKGKFLMNINENDRLKKVSNLIEKPLSIEIFDEHPFVQGNVNWVKKNTTYTQKLKLNSDKDFQIPGVIQFVIEPRCTLEKIPFTIIYENGEMKIDLNRC